MERHVVLYDADCGFCRWSLDKILRWDRCRQLRAVAIQSEEGDRLLAGMSEDEWWATYAPLLERVFDAEIFPVLTPLAFDPGRPLPFLANRSATSRDVLV